MRLVTVMWMLALGACGFSVNGGVDIDAAPGGEGPPPIDAVTMDSFVTGTFTTPVLVAEVSMALNRDDDVTLTGDLLEMFFESDRVIAGNGDIYTSTRATADVAWSAPVRIEELSTGYTETSMEVSTDGLTMYFTSNRPPAINGTLDIFMSTRATRTSAWTTPVHVPSLSSASSDYNAQPWSETVLYLGSDRQPAKGGSDVFRTTRANAAAAWGTAAVIEGLDTNIYEGEAFADATKAVWFTGPGFSGDNDIWRAYPNLDGTYQMPQRVTELQTLASETDAWISPDGRTIYFTSNAEGSLDIYMATR